MNGPPSLPACTRAPALAVPQLLDEGSPFLELSPLAGKDLYGERGAAQTQHHQLSESLAERAGCLLSKFVARLRSPCGEAPARTSAHARMQGMPQCVWFCSP